LEELVELMIDANVDRRRLENLRRTEGTSHDFQEEVCLIARRHEEGHLTRET
jgi:hypothetical protein